MFSQVYMMDYRVSRIKNILPLRQMLVPNDFLIHDPSDKNKTRLVGEVAKWKVKKYNCHSTILWKVHWTLWTTNILYFSLHSNCLHMLNTTKPQSHLMRCPPDWLQNLVLDGDFLLLFHFLCCHDCSSLIVQLPYNWQFNGKWHPHGVPRERHRKGKIDTRVSSKNSLRSYHFRLVSEQRKTK